jgi:hypothetical protein
MTRSSLRTSIAVQIDGPAAQRQGHSRLAESVPESSFRLPAPSLIPWYLPRGSPRENSSTQLISDEKFCSRLGAPNGCPCNSSMPQVIENMVGERGFEPLASCSETTEISQVVDFSIHVSGASTA